MPRLWEIENQQSVFDDHDAKERAQAWKKHERLLKKFGPNYQKVVDERRAKRRRKAEAARAERAARTCAACGLVCSKPSEVRVHKALKHEHVEAQPA